MITRMTDSMIFFRGIYSDIYGGGSNYEFETVLKCSHYFAIM